MKNGVDPRAFAAELKAANTRERLQLTGLYARWIKEGAEAQTWRGSVGLILAGSAIFAASSLAMGKVGSPTLYAGCGVLAFCGVLLTRAGWRREGEWRRSNPFNDWRRSN